MRRRQIPIRDPGRNDGDDDVYATYGRPSVSAWVAAAAVAFSFFLLGGFIKTYRQLESLREESRREIADLRDSVRRLQQGAPPAEAAARPLAGRAAPRFTPLPQASRRGAAPLQPTPSSSMMPAAVPREPVRAAVPTPAPAPVLEEALRYEIQESQPKRPRYQVGRRGDGDTGALVSAAGGACQVVSVSTAQKMVMVEGGRDMALDEGERLELCRDGRWIADLRVMDVFDNQSSCEVLHATLPPEPGDTIRRPPQSR